MHRLPQHCEVGVSSSKVKGNVMTMTDNRPNTVIGTRLLRREDPALLTGEGKFTNDLNIPGALHLAIKHLELCIPGQLHYF